MAKFRGRHWIWGLGVAIATSLLVVVGQASLWAQNPEMPADPPEAITLEAANLTLEELADGVYGLVANTDFPPADPTTTAICNGGIIIGSDGVAVVDPFQNDALAALMLETVAGLTDQPVRYVINTHYHFDHTGGNATAEARSLPILGRGPIRDFMLSRNLELDPNPVPPSVIVNDKGELWLGDRMVQIQQVDGHSGGTDLVVYVPDVDVLMAGDLLFHERIPYVADANLRLWQDHLDELMATYPTATILPGHGAVTNLQGLMQQQDYFDTLEALALEWKAEGLSQAEAIARTSLPETYSDYLFQGLFTGNLEVAYQQITLGQDDAASVQRYFRAQAPALKAL